MNFCALTSGEKSDEKRRDQRQSADPRAAQERGPGYPGDRRGQLLQRRQLHRALRQTLGLRHGAEQRLRYFRQTPN